MSKHFSFLFFVLAALILFSCQSDDDNSDGSSSNSDDSSSSTVSVEIFSGNSVISGDQGLSPADNGYSLLKTATVGEKLSSIQVITTSTTTDYLVYGGNTAVATPNFSVSGDIDTFPLSYDYRLLGSSDRTATFQGEYLYYIIKSANNGAVRIDSVLGSDGNYYGTTFTSNTSNTSNIKTTGEPDGNVGVIFNGGHALIQTTSFFVVSSTDDYFLLKVGSGEAAYLSDVMGNVSGDASITSSKNSSNTSRLSGNPDGNNVGIGTIDNDNGAYVLIDGSQNTQMGFWFSLINSGNTPVIPRILPINSTLNDESIDSNKDKFYFFSTEGNGSHAITANFNTSKDLDLELCGDLECSIVISSVKTDNTGISTLTANISGDYWLKVSEKIGSDTSYTLKNIF